MKHWHLLTLNEDRKILAAARYDNAAKSINDYVDLVYNIFPSIVDEGDRVTYLNNMLSLTEGGSGYHIYVSSKELNLSWTDCDDPCSFGVYN